MTGAFQSPARRAAASCAVLLASILALAAVGCSGGPKPADGSGGTSHAAAAPKPKVWSPVAPDTTGPIVGVVGGRKVTRHEVDSLIATAPSNLQPQLREPDGYRQVVDRIITQEAVYQAAIRDSIQKDPTYRGELARLTRELAMNRYYQMAVLQMPAVPDSVTRAYYDSHQEQFTIAARARVRQIMTKTRAQALSVRRSLEAGALWDATCRAKSIDAASKDNGGQIGYLSPDSDMVPGMGKAPAVVAAAFSLPIGAVSQPLKTANGWHLIKVDSREDRTVQPYEDVKQRIEMDLRQGQQEAFGKALTDSLKRYANATIFDDSIQVALEVPKTAADFFKEAQAATTPTQRIDLYRSLIRRYPSDPVAIQARFMIGFTYAEELDERELATQAFEEFLRLHPDSELAGSAKWMMENMDKPPPELEEPEPDGNGQGAPPEAPGQGSGDGAGGSKASP